MSELHEIEVEGATLEEAKLRAEGRLGALPEDLEITVLQEGKQGMLGLFSRPWRIRAKQREDGPEAAVDLLRSFFHALQIDVEPQVRREEGYVFLDLEGDFDWLTRRRGEALEALQYVLSAAVGKRGSERLVLDAGGYRAARRRALEKLAREVAERVTETGEATPLESMTAAERRIIHSVIQEYPDLTSQSRGEEPHRQVVIQRR